MKRLRILSAIWLALFMVACAPAYTINHSVPVKPLSLPDDLAAHYWAQTEWWYYTGHLKGNDGKDYGYEITFLKELPMKIKCLSFSFPSLLTGLRMCP